MLLGFISFLLSVFQKFINHICIPESAAHLMLPCITRETSETTEDASKLCKRKVGCELWRDFLKLLGIFDKLHHEVSTLDCLALLFFTKEFVSCGYLFFLEE